MPHELLTAVFQLERKESCILREKLQKNSVALPDWKRADLFQSHPFKHPFLIFTAKDFGQFFIADSAGKKVHVFCAPFVRYECDNAAEAQILCSERKPCLFMNFPQGAFFRAFTFFKFSADTDPFVFILVNRFFDTVKHQISAGILNIAKGSISHFHHPGVL